MIFPTLVFQLAYQYPPFRQQLLQVLRASPDIGQESLCSQMEKIIVGPLKATHIPTLIIIDALDECKDEEPASAILSILSRYVGQIPDVKFFITGRPEPRIRSGFRLANLQPITEVLRLHDVGRSSVDIDIKLFLRTQLDEIAKTRSDHDFTEEWPTSADMNILLEKAAGLFIYASTVIKFVESENHLPTTRLSLVTSFPQSTFEEGRSGIDALYTQILEQAFHNIHMDDKGFYAHFRSRLGVVLLLLNPLPIKVLSNLMRASDIHTTFRSLHSLLLIPKTMEDPIRVFHKSFPDFLTDPERCRDKRFFINPSIHHQEILFLCLNLMKERLKRNICNLDDYTILSKIKDLPAHRGTCLGGALEYACKFWTRHLLEIPSSSHSVKEIHEAINDFFTTQLPYWIEVLSLVGNLGLGVHAINNIHKWYTSVSCGLSTHQNQCLHLLFRQVIPASGQVIPNGSSWKILMQSATLPPTSTAMLSHFPPPHLGSRKATVQSSYTQLRWSKGSQTGGGLVPAQFPPVAPLRPLYAGKTLLQLGYHLVISLSSMKLLEPTHLSFLATLMK